MKLIFKQFFKTFLRNILLIIGLSSLVGVTSFLISVSTNLTQSFNQSLTKLNNKGKKANVVANIPSDFGYLDFSWTTADYEVTTYMSSLSLQKDESGNFTREANTFFPYSKNQLETRTANFGPSTGITVNPDETELKNMFTLDIDNPNAIWNYVYGLTVRPLINLSIKSALSYSFVDDDMNVIFNPKTLLFNQYGIPFSTLQKGVNNNYYNLQVRFENPNDDVVNAQPEIYDEQGYGILNNFFNRSLKKEVNLSFHDVLAKYNIDISKHNTWRYDQSFHLDVFSRFIQKVDTIPFIFEINLDNSTGPVKAFIQSHPELFEYAFNSIFNANHYSRDDVPGGFDNNVVSNISLIKTSNDTYQIQLAVSDDVFIDYSSQMEPEQQITHNKNLYMNNFKRYLSSEFNRKLYDLFTQKINLDLEEQDITMQTESEYYYRDSAENTEYLYTATNSDNPNSVVVYRGNNIYDNKSFIELYEQLTNRLEYGKISKQNIYALDAILNKVPISSINGYDKNLSSKLSTSATDFTWFQFLRFCTYHVVEELKKDNLNSDHLPDYIYDSPYFIMLSKLCNFDFDILFNGNQIVIDINFTNNFSVANSTKNYRVLMLENFMCVISNAYAEINKKKYLPTKVNKSIDKEWKQKLNEIGNNEKQFEEWIISIANTDSMELTFSQVKEFFSDKQGFFNIWTSYLSDDFKIYYKETFFLISGFGLSPDFAFPVISPTAPIPDPKTQVVVYLNSMAYNSLNISSVNKTEYYSFYSDSKSNKEIINNIKNISTSLIGSDIYNPTNILKAVNMQTIYLRSFFPHKIRSILIIFTVVAVIFLVLLSLVIVYLILKSFIKNMVEPIALCVANGISIWKIILSCITNFAIFLTPIIMIAYLIAYFVQPFYLSLFASIWLVPGTFAVPFTPLIFIPLIVCILLAFGGILSFVIYNKFKKPIPQIVANKQDVTYNRFTKLISTARIRLHSILKLSLGFSSINLGRLGLITLLGSISLGAISSSIIISNKFDTAQKLTNESRSYEFQYDLAKIYESTGLYKPQKFAEIGMEDTSVGINSIYLKKSEWDNILNSENRYPYYYEQLQIKKIPRHGNESSITNVNGKYLSNIILPSYKIYNQINSGDFYTFFNSAASLFLLDLSITFVNFITVNIWDIIKERIPDWLVNQLEQQGGYFQNAIMKKYGEWYYKFINVDNESITLTENNTLTLSNVDEETSGYYYAITKVGLNEYRTKPYYVWVDSDQWYWTNAVDIHSRHNLKTGRSIDLNYNKSSDFYNRRGVQTDISSQNAKIEWKFVPAFNSYHQLDKSKIQNKSDDDVYNIRFSDEFLQFITTIYGDEDVAYEDSKISFGIIPFDKEIEETYTKVTGRISGIIDIFNQPVPISKPNIEIMGIKPNSKYIILNNEKGEDISSLINKQTYSNTIDIIINEGASLDYKLKVGSTFELDVSNNVLTTSYELMHNIIGLNKNPISTKYKFKVVGINQDSFGARFYINQAIANEISGLSDMKVYTQMVTLEEKENEVEPEQPEVKPEQPTDLEKDNVEYLTQFKTEIVRQSPTSLSSDYIPFNGIFSKNPELLISYKSIPFYTFASIWNTWTSTASINNIDMNSIYEALVTTNDELLLATGNYIKDNINANFVVSNDMDALRSAIVTFLIENYGQSSFLSAINDIGINDLLSVALNTAVPSAIVNNMFSMISNLITTLIIISIAILIPLLAFVLMVTSFSIIGDLTKNLALMKILGFSDRNILITVALMYIPIFILATMIGVGITFALNFGLQYLIYNLTSIFVTQAINVWILLAAIGVIALIFTAAILLTLFISRRQGLENNLKF